jgi:nucleotide-binding universal stress UspA family protein
MFRRMLVPVDGSAAASAALAQAIGLARESGSRLRIVHVIGEIEGIYAQAHGWDMTRVLGQLKHAATELLGSALKRAHEAGVEAETGVLESPDRPVWGSIVDDAVRWRADVIVIGTHGRRGISRLVMGSDAESVIRSSPVPVLTVRGA